MDNLADRLQRQYWARKHARRELRQIEDELPNYRNTVAAEIYQEVMSQQESTDPIELLKELRSRMNRFVVSATQQVLNTTELLENILLNLPEKDLFVFQIVSRDWRDCIRSSPEIQAKLFPVPEEAEHWVGIKQTETILRGTVPCQCPPPPLFGPGASPHATPIISNPVLFRSIRHLAHRNTTFLHRAQRDAYLLLNVDLRKVNSDSSCLRLSITSGPGYFDDINVLGTAHRNISGYEDGRSSAFPLCVTLPRKVPRRALTLGDVWRLAMKENLQLDSPIFVSIPSSVETTQSMLAFVRDNGHYVMCKIAQLENASILRNVVKYLPLSDYLALQGVCQNFRTALNILDHPETKRFESIGDDGEAWLLATANDYSGLECRFDQSYLSDSSFESMLSSLCRKKLGTSAFHSAHIPLIYNELLFDRNETIIQQARQDYAELMIKKRLTSLVPSTPAWTLFVTNACPDTVEIESVDYNGTSSWHEIEIYQLCGGKIGRLLDIIKAMNGTGKIRFREYIAVTMEEWHEAQRAPKIDALSVIAEVEGA